MRGPRAWRLFYELEDGSLELAATSLERSGPAAIGRARRLGLVDRRRRLVAIELDRLEVISPRRRSRRRRGEDRARATRGGRG